MRYQTNGHTPIRLINRINSAIQTYALRPEMTAAKANMGQVYGDEVGCCHIFNDSYMAAIIIVGIANKKEKRAATSRLNPNANPMVKVIPEREVPGTNASICAQPMDNAERQFN